MYGKYSPPASPPMSPTVTLTQTQSPLHVSARQQARHTATAKRQKFLRRLFYFRQMDFEYACWQMLYLFVSPQKVYRNFAYRKETKDQWARDDPAFLVLLSFWLCASSVGFSIVLGLSVVGFIKFLLWVVFVDCIGVGLAMATLLWFITNRYLIVQPPARHDVEWGYCFDVHLNAFFPLLLILHFFQLPFINSVINQDWMVARMCGNTFWLFAIGYYMYITFLGYSSLHFLKKTQVFLYPMTVLLLLYLLSIIIGWNFTRGLCNFYTYRVFQAV